MTRDLQTANHQIKNIWQNLITSTCGARNLNINSELTKGTAILNNCHLFITDENLLSAASPPERHSLNSIIIAYPYLAIHFFYHLFTFQISCFDGFLYSGDNGSNNSTTMSFEKNSFQFNIKQIKYIFNRYFNHTATYEVTASLCQELFILMKAEIAQQAQATEHQECALRFLRRQFLQQQYYKYRELQVSNCYLIEHERKQNKNLIKTYLLFIALIITCFSVVFFIPETTISLLSTVCSAIFLVLPIYLRHKKSTNVIRAQTSQKCLELQNKLDAITIMLTLHSRKFSADGNLITLDKDSKTTTSSLAFDILAEGKKAYKKTLLLRTINENISDLSSKQQDLVLKIMNTSIDIEGKSVHQVIDLSDNIQLKASFNQLFNATAINILKPI